MNPGLVVKLRPSGPWRIGPDTGARNQVDVIYHSDSLYSAVTSALERLGSLEEWLAATARNGTSAVCFSSCFPFVEEIGFIVPPRTIWPPSAAGLTPARVRWKSARFVPLGIVQALLAGQTLDETHWTVDAASGCLLPAGQAGPFRMGIRSNAAVDRLTGATERHSTACLEFRPGAGLWTIVSFADEAARNRWSDPVRAAFRLLADSGFGGERSRGWGRAEAPEFTDGSLPLMILGSPRAEAAKPSNRALNATAPLEPQASPEASPVAEERLESEPELTNPGPAETEPVTASTQTAGIESQAKEAQAHWLLSLFTPAAEDSVDWARGNYTLVARGGRVESRAGSGGLKKDLQMVAEGSVLYAGTALRGSAPDVAPDGFAHPVFRAGFAVSIPLPEAG